MGEARAALRGLLRALQRYTPNNGDFRTRVVNEFRTNAALTAEEAKPGIALAKDYTFLLHSVNGHLVGTCARSLARSLARPIDRPDPSPRPCFRIHRLNRFAPLSLSPVRHDRSSCLT